MAGDGWTGAFGTGTQTILSSDSSSVSPEERENNFKRIDGVQGIGKIVNVAAGWGHSVLVCKSAENETKLYVAGRPFDFQALLRLYRLPSFIRRPALSLSLNLDEETRKSVFPYFEEVTLPDGDMPSIEINHQNLAASAGLTAVIGKTGKAYMFGLNKSGQCGVGNTEAIHIWKPTPIDFPMGNEERVVTDVALGLQHGLVLDKDGSLHAFGKGSRGQLGITDQQLEGGLEEGPNDAKSNSDFAFSPVRVREFELQGEDLKYSKLSGTDSAVLKISAGWNHSAAVTRSNHAWIWGKNVLIDSSSGSKTGTIDSTQPIHIKGLPELEILDISCGSHHTSILMEDGSVFATGIATDTNNIVGGELAVQIIPPGIIDLPLRQFKSHFDRTTIIAGEDGQQILEVQLWSTENLRRDAVFEPAWVDTINATCEKILTIQRGWLHSIVVG